MNNTKLTYDDDNLQLKIENKTYRVELHAEASYWRTSGTMYRSNGDPGDPPDEGLELESVVANWYLLDEGEKKINPAKEMLDELYDYLYDMDVEDWKLED